MTAIEFLKKILETIGIDGSLTVSIDGSVPKPFEEFFDIKKDRGHLLFVPKKKENE